MNCRAARRRATEYVDGDLDPGRMSALRGHLRGCESCHRYYEEEVQLKDAAADLEPLEPPSSLWEGIQASLAELEIADSNRSPMWFWARGIWHQHRGHVVGLALAVACVGVVVGSDWVQRGDVHRGDGEPTTAKAVAPALDATDRDPVPLGFEEARSEEIARADARYAGVIAELRSVAAEQRASWPARQRQQFDDAVARYDERAAVARQAGLMNRDVFARDELYAAYREQIDFLTDVTLEGGLP